jgi:general secretion pathway protein G
MKLIEQSARLATSLAMRIRVNRQLLDRGALASARRCNGFTLVELLLVLVILATLAAIVVPKFSGRTEQARKTAAVAQIANFGVALDAFEVDCGYYPKGKDGLEDLLIQPRDENNWKGPYVKGEIPKDPWGNDYIYECPGRYNDKSYDIMSMGPDGRVGGDDDIANWNQNVRR